MAQHQCNACHGGEQATGAPSLEGVGTRLETAWLASWIKDPKSHRSSARMPRLFKGGEAEQSAADIANFLAPPNASPPSPAIPMSDTAIKAGGLVFHEQGCIGCHTLEAQGDAERIGLGEIAHKFRPFALAAFLREPSENHGDTRMPDFAFDEAEANSLEVFLRSLSKSKALPIAKGDRDRGEQLFKQSGCINCHQSADLKSELATVQPATGANCMVAEFAFNEKQQTAIAATLSHPIKPLTVPAEIAAHNFTTLRCAACHERDSQPAYRDTFAKEVEHLAPPAEGAHQANIPQLTHLGAKLLPEWRTALFKGEIEPKTRPWLKARMPAFASRAETLSTGFNHAVGLPANTPDLPDPDADKIKIGAELTGLTGFACATCHGIGDQKAIAVFEGEGPNFRDVGARLQRDYFQLWMSDPPRMWPGTIMPKYTSENQSPLTQHYDGDAAKQFDAIRDYIRSLQQ
ncbi:MAG: mono/diheme cytochrome c family protein [Pseudoalteromonas tetraodonis]